MTTSTAMQDLLAASRQAFGDTQLVEPTPEPTQPLGVALSPELLAKLPELVAARELAEVAKRAAAAIRDEVLETLGDATVGLDAAGNVVVTTQPGSMTKTDDDKLRSVYPEAYTGTRKTTHYKSVKVVKS